MTVGKYRKKPVVIDALQLLWANWNEMCDFAGVGYLKDGKPEGCYIGADGKDTDEPSDTIGLRIPTLEGVMVGREGDWIVRGVANELYPVKDEIFRETYELAEGEAVMD